MAAAARFVVVFLIGFVIRWFLILFPGRLSWIFTGIGVTTPQNSWKRVTEGIYLHRKGLDPYSGGMFHETPLLLVCFDYVTENCKCLVPVIFVLSDLTTAFVLSRIASNVVRHLLLSQTELCDMFSSKSEKLLLRAADLCPVSFYVAVSYLFHPYSIASCCGYSTTVFANLIVSLAIYFTAKGRVIPSCVFLSLATYQCLYPAMLIVPCIVHLSQKRAPKSNLSLSLTSVVTSLALFSTLLVTLVAFSSKLMGSWKFLDGVYGLVLFVDDLTPNVGLFWYFFTELFEHFRSFFLCAFQINAFIYVLPLTFKFRDDPMFVVFLLLALMSVFKSYPSVGDIALYTSLIPIWFHLYPYMRQAFVICCIFLACTVLGPLLYHMWIFSGSANANFFFGTTLALNTAQIFLVTDLMFAHIKRDYHLRHGPEVTTLGGKPGKLLLE